MFPDDDASALFEQDGVLTSVQAAAALGPGRARAKLDKKQWRRVCQGVLVTHNGPLTERQALWVAVLAAGKGAVLAGLAAAYESGLRPRRPGPIHVLVPGKRASADLARRLPPDIPPVFVHRAVHLPAEHIQRGRPPRTTLPRSLVDAAQWARSDQHAQVIIATAFQQRLVTPDEIRAAIAVLPRARRRKLVLETVAFAVDGATTSGEIALVKLCRDHGLPKPDMQVHRTDKSGRNRYLDAYWRDWRLHVEIDGAHHMEAGQWEDDMGRQNEVWIAGDRILRFSARQVLREPARVAEQLAAALRAAGWPG